MNAVFESFKYFRSDIFGNIGFACSLIIVFLIPVYVHYTPPFMIVWGLSWLLSFNWRALKEVASLNKYSILISLCFLSFVLWQLIGIIYSVDRPTGIRFFFSRLSLFLFPLVLSIPQTKIKNNISLLMKVFTIGALISVFICFAVATIKSITISNNHLIFNSHPSEAPWESYYFGFHLAFNQHPSYLSIYLILSVFIAFEFFNSKTQNSVSKIFWLSSGLLFIVTVYLLSSRTGIIALLILLPVYFFSKTKVKFTKFLGPLMICILVLIGFTVIYTNSRTKVFFEGAMSGTLKDEMIKDGRILIWQAALRPIKSNLVLGTGTGGVDAAMKSEYMKIGKEEWKIRRWNLHNQFLEILLENGIIGLLLFTSVLSILFYFAFVQKNIMFGFFLFSMMIFFLFETVLNRLQGVSYFPLFSFLLFHLKGSQDKQLKKAK